LTKRSPEWN